MSKNITTQNSGNNNYDVLENQIGSEGGAMAETGKSLGKLTHASEILGGQRDLTNSELKDFNEFKKRGIEERSKRAAFGNTENTPNIGEGWIQLNRSEMGERSQFYPAGWEFFIKPASMMSVKNWTAVDETNPAQVNKVMSEIIRSSVRINTHDINPAGWQYINSWDKFWFILKVRQATFVSGDYKIEFNDSCSECGSDITYELTPEALSFDLPAQEQIEKYWKGNHWEINPAEFDVIEDNGTSYTQPVLLFPPTIGKDNAIIEWASEKVQLKQNIDQTFIKFLPWLIQGIPSATDPVARNASINQAYRRYKSWGLVMFEWMSSVIDGINVIPSDTLTRICPNCGQEAHSQVRFPDGIKTLFLIKSKAKSFTRRGVSDK